MQRIFFFLLFLIFTFACEKAANQTAEAGTKMITEEVQSYLTGTNTDTLEVATFSGGHFYGLEAVFEQLRGTQIVLTGYTGGKSDGPGFEEVNNGASGHRMAIQVYFDPKKISYQMLLAVYFSAHDPTQKEQQGIEKGPPFIPAIYVHNDQQRKLAEAERKNQQEKSKYTGKKLTTEIVDYTNFWVAEEQHQDFVRNNIQDDYVQNVIKPYIREVEKKYGAWMLRGKSIFPVTQDAKTPGNSN